MDLLLGCMTSEITFTDVVGVGSDYAPIPAVQSLPDWYKKTPEYITGERVIVDGGTPHTIKKCVPVFDALTAGYLLRTYVDVQVTERDGLPYYEWPQFTAIALHPIEQANMHPAHNGAPYPKWINPWSIRTPRGYSCLFTTPMHRSNELFTILPGIVDTDTYHAPVNFPFVMHDRKWSGIIPAGTPLAQVIPFRREAWKMRMGNDNERAAQAKVTGKLRALWWNSYKRQFWSRKEYR